MGRKTPSKSTDTESTKTSPTWNTSPNSLPEYFSELTEWLRSQDTDYATLVQYGYVINGKHVCCISHNHIDRVVMGTIVKGTFKDPCIITRGDVVAFPADVATPSSKLKDDGSPDPQYSRYVINPEKIEETDMALATEIRKTIAATDYGNKFMEECNDSGREMLQRLKDKVANMPTNITNYGAGISAKIDLRLKQGIDTPTVAAFTLLIEDVTSQRDLLPDSLKPAYSDTILATRLQDAARGLGPHLYSEINAELRSKGGRGDLAKTKEAIIEVLRAQRLWPPTRATERMPCHSTARDGPNLWMQRWPIMTATSPGSGCPPTHCPPGAN
jgi:signal peptidase I